MNIKFKKAALAPLWILRLNKIRKLSKKYKSGKRELSAQFRNDFITKYADKILKTHNVEVKVFGYENIVKGPALLVPNHLSNADALIIMSALKNPSEAKEDLNKISTFLAKKELYDKKISRHILNLIDTFFIDREKIRESVTVLNDFGKYVKENKTYGVIFPEGTRSKDGNLGDFKAGAFTIAKKLLLPIIPVTINYSGLVFDSSRKEKLNVEIHFHPAIKAASHSAQENEAISQRVKEIISSKYIPSSPEKRKEKK